MTDAILGTTVREGDILQGKYRVGRVLGSGGMGFVVAAHHLHLDAAVAIKSLLPQGRAHAEVLARFEREARTAVKIKSEHVARVLDVARFDDGTPYLVMEHLDGNDLSKWLHTRGPLSVEQAVEFIVQACEAIAEAHSLGIVHRDLKPANLFVVKGRDGLLMSKVIDFGISKSSSSDTTSDGAAGRPSANEMTGTRSMLGSPEYMSPEQFTAPKTVDWRTDIWSLGVTLFELLSGRLPFSGDELITLAMKIAQDPTPMSILSHAGVPAELSSVIRRCLEKNRAARYQDVAELAAALAPFAPSRTQALIQRIARIVHEGRSTSASSNAATLAATAFAQPLPLPIPIPTAPTAAAYPTQHGTQLAQHPSTWPTGAMTPFVSSIPAPPLPMMKTRNGLLIALALAAAGALGVLVMILAVMSLRTTVRTSAAAAAPTAQEPQPEASAAPSSVPTVVVTPAPELSSEPATKSSAAPETFHGTNEVKRVTWTFDGVVYRGVIHTNGTTGYADVSFIEPGHGPVVVRENLRLQQGKRGWAYVGSNPRYVDDGSPANFIPNAFYMEGTSGTFAETCVIGVGICSRVSGG